MNADARLADEINGIYPNKSSHQSILRFDPVFISFPRFQNIRKYIFLKKCTGIPVAGNVRLQLNLYLENDRKYK